MPAIILFNRGWQFSSDDLVFSSILVIFLRSLCIPFTLAPLIIWDHSQPYVPTNLLEVVYFGIAIDVVQIIVRSALAIASSRGGISEVDKRRPVVPIFYLYLFLIVLEISVYSTAIYLEASYSERHANVCFFLRVVCISDLFLLVTNVIVFLISFDSTGHVWRNHPELWCFEESDDSHRLNFDQAHAVVARLWRRRIRCLSCSRSICSRMNLNAKPQSHDAMMLVSDIVGQYFMTNLVASDVLAGLLLLRWQTYQWVGCGRRVPLQRIIEDSDIYDPVTDPPPHSNPPSISPAQGSEDPFSRLASDWLSIRRLWIYSKFASAVYGRLLYVFSHHLSPRASFRLCKHMQCLGGARSCCTCGNEDLNHPETHPFLNQSDDITAGCCICNRDTCNIAVYQEVTGAPIESLVYYSSVNDCQHRALLQVLRCVSHSGLRHSVSPQHSHSERPQVASSLCPARLQSAEISSSQSGGRYCGPELLTPIVLSINKQKHWTVQGSFRRDLPIPSAPPKGARPSTTPCCVNNHLPSLRLGSP
uniref:Lipase_3 domain-containing protein n=1 Tax=Mesocestoides corti TaxID=53468 RepID=A0A5K3EKU6_MESCO